MKIIKHTFKTPKLKVVDGNLVEDGYIEETCTFTLLNKGVGLYEELSNGEPLMATLSTFKGDESDVAKLLASDFVPNLACASYVKIDGDKFHNNRATAEEFKKKPFYSKVTEDVNFIRELIEMAMDCMMDKRQKTIKKGDNQPKK